MVKTLMRMMMQWRRFLRTLVGGWEMCFFMVWVSTGPFNTASPRKNLARSNRHLYQSWYQSDGPHWDGMAMARYYTHLAEVICDSEALFDIWKVFHQFTLAHYQLHNGQNVHQQFMFSHTFEKQFVLEPASDKQDSDGQNILILNCHSISVLAETKTALKAFGWCVHICLGVRAAFWWPMQLCRNCSLGWIGTNHCWKSGERRGWWLPLIF